MQCLALDPGPERTAALVYEPSMGRVEVLGILENDDLLARLSGWYEGTQAHLAIEMIASFGMPVGKTIFETVFWIGRFYEAWPGPVSRVYRKDVKMHLCNHPRAKDGNIRQALIDRFGGSKPAAVGTKPKPGPLYGVKLDLWAALGVAVTFADVVWHRDRGAA